MRDETIEAMIAPVLSGSFGHHGLEGFAVRPGEDHDGDPVLFVSIRFGSAATLPAGDETTGAMVAIRRLLLANGESRFPHLTFEYPDDPDTRLRLRSQWLDLARP